MRQIPKIIHYCWFGGNPLPADVQHYIDTWKRHMPDYEIIEWNEKNFDIDSSIPYVQEAYKSKKYAFVSDYARICALYQYGGVYFDTDVEVLKNFDALLEDKKMVLGFESDRSLITAFIATEKENQILKEFVEEYQTRSFILPDGSLDTKTINEGFSSLMEKHGVDLDSNVYQQPGEGIVVYPIDTFCGFDVPHWHERVTKETYTVHHMAGSWVSDKQNFKIKIIKTLQKVLGYEKYDKLQERLRK